MNAAELLQKIIAYGADEEGINDRFLGNAELYESCFREFLEEPNFELLGRAMEQKDYEQAFAAAHALKGIAGNLGVTAFYGAVCTLVESLRAKSYGTVEAEYANVVRQLQNLKWLLSDGGAPSGEPAPGGEEAAENTAQDASEKRKKDRFIPTAIAALAVLIVCVGSLFVSVFNNYEKNISTESAGHLIEISRQLKLYIEERLETDWKIARSVGESIANIPFENDEDIFQMLVRRRNVWHVTDIMLYTENGCSICSDGDVEANDIASETIDKARRLDGYLSIIDSEIIYTIPIETELRYNGSPIVAVSVVQGMESFLDDMGFSSFDGKAWMYLTEENGIVISRLTNAAARPAFNFMAITTGREITPLTDGDHPDADLMRVEEPTTFLMTGEQGNEYVVSAPIFTRGTSLRLFYLAPEAVVNETMNGFSRQLLLLSTLVIALFAISAVVVFLYIYSARKRQFDEALLARERMFDLLVKNTQTAFGLFDVRQSAPDYVSSNSLSVVGDPCMSLDKTDAGFCMQNSTGTDTHMVAEINAQMRGWDGRSAFKSGYILNDRAVPPNYFEIQLYPVDDEGRDFVGIAQDVTQAHAREEATRNALEMAERANEAKSRFLSNMSHDIRTPMNAIINMANFALESLDRPKQLKSYLQTICESSEHLLRLINDVLDMSRIESGQTVVESAPFDVEAEIMRQADIIRPLCRAKNQTLLTDFDGIHTSCVCGDALKFSQIIANLLNNANKFTPEKGAIRFTAEEIPSLREDIVDIRFTVEDNGIGISPAYIDRIFEPFSRADDRRVSRIEGSGLGLSICHSYVAAMGGLIKCESEEGEGSVFTVELFFEKADALPEKQADPETLEQTPFLGKRCLVAEDNAVNRTIAKTMLERLGFFVETAADGWEAVQMFFRSKPGYYDVIYMDIQMPVMDGYQAAVTIRESGHAQAATIPIVAMTANVFAEDIEKARIAGMDGHLGKPVMSIKLLAETYRVFNREREERP